MHRSARFLTGELKQTVRQHESSRHSYSNENSSNDNDEQKNVDKVDHVNESTTPTGDEEVWVCADFEVFDALRLGLLQGPHDSLR